MDGALGVHCECSAAREQLRICNVNGACSYLLCASLRRAYLYRIEVSRLATFLPHDWSSLRWVRCTGHALAREPPQASADPPCSFATVRRAPTSVEVPRQLALLR